MTQSSCPVTQGDLDYANKCFVKNFKIQDNTVSLLAFPSISQYDCEDVQQWLKKGDMIVTTCEKLCKCDNKDSRCSNIKKTRHTQRNYKQIHANFQKMMMEMNTHKPSYLKELLCQVLVA